MKLLYFILVALVAIAASPARINAEDDTDADERVPPRVPIQDAVIQNAEDREDDSRPNGDYAAPQIQPQPVYNAPGGQYGSPRLNVDIQEGIRGGNGPIIEDNPVPLPAPVFSGSGGYNNGPKFTTFPIINPVPVVVRQEPIPVPLPRPVSNYGSPRFLHSQPQPTFGFRGGFSDSGSVTYGAPSVTRVISNPNIGYGAPQFRENVGFGSLTSVNYPQFVRHHQHNRQGGYSGGGGFDYRNYYHYRPGFSSVVGPTFGSGGSGSGYSGGVSGGYA